MGDDEKALTGLRVFAVEDDLNIACMVEEMLEALGHEVAFSADSLDLALEVARGAEFDLAVLDVNLHGTESYPVASILQERGIPFLFATGYGPDGVGNWRHHASVLTKPFNVAQLGVAIRATIEGRREPASEPALSLYDLGELLLGESPRIVASQRNRVA